MTILLAVTAILAQPTFPTGCTGVQFSRAPAMAGRTERVSICPDPDGGRGDVLFRRSSTARGVPATISYARTSTCPAARAQLEALESLTMPRPDVPGFRDELQVNTLDGASFRLEAPALYGPRRTDLILESNVGTPLARWISTTLAALAPCWREPPNP